MRCPIFRATGVKAELAELTRSGSTEETIAADVARRGAELLVMGKDGHSRMREFLFGGVTRYFLEGQPVSGAASGALRKAKPRNLLLHRSIGTPVPPQLFVHFC